MASSPKSQPARKALTLLMFFPPHYFTSKDHEEDSFSLGDTRLLIEGFFDF
jgi:hypothetical protein